jgi:hypothetical protein
MSQDSRRHGAAVCPRCGRPLHEPTAWSSAWRCDWHGEVHPLLPAFSPSRDGLDGMLRMLRLGTESPGPVLRDTVLSGPAPLGAVIPGAVPSGLGGVPAWLPWPLPASWLVAGFAGAGDERTGARACAVALTGPNPVGGPADMVVVAEDPGVGLGAGLAGLDSVDPGAGFASAPAVAAASFGNHDFPLWQVASPDRAVFAGEVEGLWLWVVLWPDSAGVLLVEPIALRDLRDPGQELDLPFGAASSRLPA